ncbi:glucose-6-phosphate dehydrogenase assembly protein OpcA [Georgenia satyanarayanai]|uniref:Glucose-6-phosphate dehydrogenase assembly protein OpcA n=1 Tax=Georgenia satyanarayanai TaxID=860221 RepID=A0A2Y8ZXB4_9MICO|nr:glucose-6-phosphate dehydrogenase assembly protein OpcA [Georgenia satyanarayanai]PYG02149.1 glucose-6-phosphate dehydrogenase assembly protein OpcA [Georgenia satyanarayanai]SSA36960.1 glucose-6-phosphate dehydrogenase assembly protein OpcA [Georgenia satyanarayanai]
MITTMHATTASAVSNRLAAMRRSSGANTFTRVLTLIIVADDLTGAEHGINAANGASREHPCRIIAVVPEGGNGPASIDAEIRVGGDAGLSEVVILQPKGEPAGAVDTLVMPLLLPDAPIVVWWTGEPPAEPSRDPLGAMAQRRITDATASADPLATLRALAPGYVPGDTDLAWSRVTLWRGLLAATLDEPPHEPILAARVTGARNRPSVYMLAAWLADSFGVPVEIDVEDSKAVTRVELERERGPITLRRTPGASVAILSRPGRIDQRINLVERALADCLTEELRRLDADETYGRVLTRGLPLVVPAEVRS